MNLGYAIFQEYKDFSRKDPKVQRKTRKEYIMSSLRFLCVKYFKKGVLTSFLLITSLLSVFSQVVTTDPEFPTANDAVTIYFDATQGNQELKDYTGDIYAHTGLITDESADPGDWKYVIAGWTENTEKAKLTEVSTNQYKLEIQPNIKEFYGLAEDEEVLQLAFVFRNSDCSLVGREADGGNIYADVYPPGLNVSISSPTDDFIILPGEQINISASSNDADSMHLWIDDVLISKFAGTSIDSAYTENIAGSHKIIIQARNTDETATDSVYYFARGNNTIVELPSGWIKGINYLSTDSVGLVLFAPHKEFVFVIGDFTDWRLNENYMMNVTPNDSVYWLSIGGLTAEKEYIFQYYIDGELRIADPYTEKISDPYNDKWINDDTYPGLIEYPDGKTTNIASVLQTNQNEYQWKNTDFIASAKENLIIYELLIRDFIAKHDYKTLIDTLNYLDSLGINAIELMPFNEFEGNESWGYNPSFYFAPDKYYGPKEDLKEFVDSCHSRGIAVIMDMVLNHSYGQSPLVQMYFDGEKPTSENPWYNIQSPNSTYSWGYDFNHESDYTKEFVDSVNRFWLEVYKIDGFRFDFTKGFTNTPGDGGSYDASRINILKRMADRIWEVNDYAYVILEHFAENTEEIELSDYGMMVWGNINHEYIEASRGYDSDISWGSYLEREWNNPYLISYMESHDEERLMYKNLNNGNSYGDYDITELATALKRIELAANFFIPIPGPKMIWQFGELGYDYSIDYDCRVCNKPIHWEYYSQEDRFRLFTVYKTLNELKQEYDVFTTSDFLITQDGKTKAINLYDDEMNVVIMGNFDVTSVFVNVSFPTIGNWFELYTGDTLSVSHSEESIIFEAGEYRFYTDVKLKQPNLPTSVLSQIQSQKLNINVFPNPSSDRFYFEINEKINDQSVLYLYDIQGQMQLEKVSYEQDIIELEATGLDNGIYFYKLIVNNNIYTGKILKN
ncbi:MAG: T9SS type A sorting domain-containing protein [Bacteroidales bacterium]|nr:T9SS type A sorting domain-containing protein [Bacteroidales bacterium]